MQFLETPTHLTLTGLANLILGLVSFAVGSVIFLKNKKDESNQLFFLIALNICLWTLTSTFADVFRTEQTALFWARMAIVGPFYSTSFFLLFSYYFPVRQGKLSILKGLAILAPSLLISPFVATKFNVSSVTLETWGTNFVPGPLYALLFIHILVNYGLAAKRFSKTYTQSTDLVARRQIMLVYLGMAFMVLSGVLTNLILPVVFNYSQASVIGPASSAFFVVLIMYAMLKHGLMDVKIIATETFSAAITFLTFIEIFDSDSVTSYALHVVMFVCTALFATLLIRRINFDERQREALKRMTEELAAKNEKLKEMDKLKSDFISIASHQLRTPISVIKGYLTLILDGAYGKVEGPMQEKVSAMVDMAERLVVMINEMLNVSRIERNKIDYVCSMFDVAEITQSIVTEMQTKAVEKGLSLTFVAHDAIGTAMAQADKDKTKEVLSNLIDNAIKYSVKGNVEVVVRARQTLQDTVVTISDEGYGIAPEDAAHMFEKFYRSNMPEIARLTGTGLGLYVCRMFLRDMGGDVWIERTALGKGTVFAFSLPMKRAGRCDLKSEIHPQVR